MAKEAKHGTLKSVLIVEDSVDFSNLLKFIVEDGGFEGVQFPITGGDIIDWAKKHKPAAILMDLALRRKGGMEYIDELKADPETKNIPIIIITGRDLGYKEIQELKMRGVKYLRKGRVETDEIKNEIKIAVREKSSSASAENKE